MSRLITVAINMNLFQILSHKIVDRICSFNSAFNSLQMSRLALSLFSKLNAKYCGNETVHDPLKPSHPSWVFNTS
ncbi:hypothetical protein QVD17_21899 [Tagetes erecta]|uniref:Uncharacterized protein n=1 Tax=Tagetes erecta TaxID=13708 RepID=A0AAD8KFJ1_TARER|nr:hypothetical protein QVD17_21899 [Tagetes erecta]